MKANNKEHEKLKFGNRPSTILFNMLITTFFNKIKKHIVNDRGGK